MDIMNYWRKTKWKNKNIPTHANYVAIHGQANLKNQRLAHSVKDMTGIITLKRIKEDIMKRSDLTLTNENYRLTPDVWGDNCIMIDEDLVIEKFAEGFGESIEAMEEILDDPNTKPDSVEIATDDDGNYYIILEPFRSNDGKWHNTDLYRPCQNPENAIDGAAEIYSNKWEHFDDEED